MRNSRCPDIAPEVRQVRCWIGLLIFGVAGCIGPTSRPTVSVRYLCASGDGFTATFSSGKVVIRTTTGAYRLLRRGGSLERYGSERVAFIRDGTTGLLVGAEGGSFDACVEAEGHGLAGSGAKLYV